MVVQKLHPAYVCIQSHFVCSFFLYSPLSQAANRAESGLNFIYPGTETWKDLCFVLSMRGRQLSVFKAINDRSGCSGTAEDPPAVLGLCLTQGIVIIFRVGDVKFNC